MSKQLDALHVDLSLKGYDRTVAGLEKVKGLVKSNAHEIGLMMQASTLGGMGRFGGGIGAAVGSLSTVKMAADLEKSRLELKRFIGSDFNRLSHGLDVLALKLPVPIEGLYEIAAGAAQVGVKGTADILAFTETVGKLATVSSMDANETAKNLAKILNVFQLPASAAKPLGSVIAGLSADSAADPGELITLMQYLSGPSATIGMRVEEVAALSAALKDAGVSSEVAGTAMKAFILQMVKDPGAFAEVIGMTENEFKKLRDEAPFRAMAMGLGAIQNQKTMDDKIAAAEGLDVKSARESGVILQLIRALKLFDQHAGNAKKYGAEMKALDEQFATQSEGVYKKITKLASALMLLGDAIGGPLTKKVGDLADAITKEVAEAVEPAQVFGGPLRAFREALTNNIVAKHLRALGLPADLVTDAERRADRENQFMASLPEAERKALEKKIEDAHQKHLRDIGDAPKDPAEEARAKLSGKRGVFADKIRALEQEHKLNAENLGIINEEINQRRKVVTQKEWEVNQFRKAKAQWAMYDAQRELGEAEHQLNEALKRRDPIQKAFDGVKTAIILAKDALAELRTPEEKKVEKEREFKMEKAARQFMLDAMTDPLRAKAMREELLIGKTGALFKDTDAHKEIVKGFLAKVDAGPLKPKQDEIMQMAARQVDAEQDVIRRAAAMKMERMNAKAQFGDADAMWKRVQSSAFQEGDPVKRILKENEMIRKATEESRDELKGLRTEMKDGMLVLSGN